MNVSVFLRCICAASLLSAPAMASTIIVNDTFADGTRTNWNPPTQCPWFHNKSSTGPVFLGAEPGTLYLTNYDVSLTMSGARYYWTYFTTNDPALTVSSTITNIFSNSTNAYFGQQVAIGTNQMIRATFLFKPEGYILPTTASGVRFALLSYENAPYGRAPRDTANGTKSGTNVTGYRVQIPIAENWAANTIMSFHARTNMNTIVDSQDPLGKASDWFSLGGGPDLTNVPAFQLDQLYSIQLWVKRYADSNVVGCDLSGPFAGVSATNFSRSYIDTSTSNYYKFDCFAIRVDGSADGLNLDRFAVKNFKVEVLPLPGALPGSFAITRKEFTTGGGFALSWQSEPDFSYHVLSTSDVENTWITNTTVTATANSTSWTNANAVGNQRRFYKVIGLPY